MRRGVASVVAAALLLGAVVATLLGSAPPAVAHTGLLSSTPADGDVVAALPDRVTLEFGGAMTTPAYVAVVGPSGEPVTVGDPAVDGSTVVQQLGPGGDGGYTVAYRVLTADGHWVTGQLTFTVGATPASAAATALPTTPGAEESPDVGSTSAPDEVATPFWSRRVVHGAISVLLFAAAATLIVASRRAER